MNANCFFPKAFRMLRLANKLSQLPTKLYIVYRNKLVSDGPIPRHRRLPAYCVTRRKSLFPYRLSTLLRPTWPEPSDGRGGAFVPRMATS